MYTQRLQSQCLGLSASRRVLPPSAPHAFGDRSIAGPSLRRATRRCRVAPSAVLEKMNKTPAKRDLPTKGLDYKPKDSGNAVQTDIVKKLEYVVGADSHSVSDRQAYQGVAWSVRERLIERFNKTQEYWRCAAGFCNKCNPYPDAH